MPTQPTGTRQSILEALKREGYKYAAQAAPFVWDGGANNNNWNAQGGNNWNPDGTPINNGTADLQFAGSVRATPNMNADELRVATDTAWTLLTGFLVFFMNAGFGLVEAGLCRKKNATMILSKNFVVSLHHSSFLLRMISSLRVASVLYFSMKPRRVRSEERSMTWGSSTCRRMQATSPSAS